LKPTGCIYRKWKAPKRAAVPIEERGAGRPRSGHDFEIYSLVGLGRFLAGLTNEH